MSDVRWLQKMRLLFHNQRRQRHWSAFFVRYFKQQMCLPGDNRSNYACITVACRVCDAEHETYHQQRVLDVRRGTNLCCKC